MYADIWNKPYSAIVHPLTYDTLTQAVNKLKETNMPTGPDCEGKEESPLQRELRNRKYRVSELRHTIARRQEELRIENALLAAVKKLAKGGK